MKKLRSFYAEDARNIVLMLSRERGGHVNLALTSDFISAFRESLEKLGIHSVGIAKCLGPKLSFSYDAYLTDEEYALVRLKFFT
jgi:hypothetical protein